MDHDTPPETSTDPEYVEIPYQQLSPDALHGVIENFVLREGTDYGEQEISLLEKIRQVQTQLERGEAKIVFDLQEESCTILPVAVSIQPHTTKEP